MPDIMIISGGAATLLLPASGIKTNCTVIAGRCDIIAL
jgi:hypothetical protein